MKNYTITVNGTSYDVTVDEKGGTASAPAPKAASTAPAAAPAAAPAPAAGAGSIQVTAGAAGKVFKIDKNVGDHVDKGETVITIEAMKMEIGCVAPEAGTVASINVSVGDPCENGTVLATLK
ncbi:MAG: acetyl-CoA carboxylase biotin carboxyl carrier protein subunit [Lachnospiraceae bacterium]|nr:acetyl-CoA carboxylase biotin carboxyl carrier protein subunit [Lachnospiraceae bacterium]